MKSQGDQVDMYLPKRLVHKEELRYLIRKYGQAIQRYYMQYLAGYDGVGLAQMTQTTTGTSEEDNVRLSSNCTKNSKPYENNGGRLQSYLSYGRNPVLEQQHDLAAHLNTASLHTRKVNNLDEMIIETSDLSLLCFAINYCATISVREAENTAGKGSGKGGSNTAGKGPGKGGSRSQTTTGDQMIANL